MVVRSLKNDAIQQGLLSHGDRVLVAVSGGPDSVTLLHILHGFMDELNLHLEVAHFQNGICREEARQGAQFLVQLESSVKL